GGAGGARIAAAAGARRAARAVVLVGLLRGLARPQRDRRRGRRAVAIPLRDRLLGPRVPAGAGRRRARRRARRGAEAAARSGRVLARSLRPRRVQARGVRHLAVRATLIVNPYASAVSEELVRAVERELAAAHEVETVLTERRGHAIELARSARPGA